MLIEPALPEKLRPEEEFTRFIKNRDYFAATTGRVKPHALRPVFNDESQRFKTSTFRSFGLTDGSLWQLGYDHVEYAEPGGTIRARATGAFALVKNPLSLDINGEPYPRHVDIIGWPQQKHDQMQHAANITDKLVLEIDPRPHT